MGTGLALGWVAALTVERGITPANDEEMYSRMSAALENYADTVERASTVTKLTRQLSADNLEGAVAAFRDHVGVPHISAFDISVFMAGWAQLEGEALLDQTREWGSDRFYRLGEHAVLHDLARRGEIERAKALFFSIPEGSREAAAAALFVSWSLFGQVDSAEEVVLSFPKGEDRDVAMQILAGQILVSQGREALKEWIDGQEAPGPELFKHSAYEYAVKALAKVSVDDARAWVLELRGTKQGWSRRGPEYLVEAWAKVDPEAAVEWAWSLESEDDVEARVRARAFGLAMERWRKANREAAASWLLLREPEELHDPHSENLAYFYSRRAPKQAAVFSNRIVNDDRRKKVEDFLRRDWKYMGKSAEVLGFLGPDGPDNLPRQPPSAVESPRAIESPQPVKSPQPMGALSP